MKFRQPANRCKMVLEAATLAYANKIRESIISQERGLKLLVAKSYLLL